MNKKQTQRVKNALRRLTFSDPFWKAAKKRAYVDAGVHRCENCGVLTYNGVSLKNVTKMFEKYGEIFTVEKPDRKKRMRYYGIEIDHIVPVVDPIEGNSGWDEFIPRLFPDSFEAYMCLCISCHSIKTKCENIDRGTDKGDWDDFFDLTEEDNPDIINIEV